MEGEQIILATDQISNFKNHPFKINDDEKMYDLVDSIKKLGVLFPAIVRPKDDGGYEMISGHRRKRACELAGIKEIPCIVKNLTDDEAIILMVDSNIQREEILFSEKAFAYKLRMEAEKRQGARTDLTSTRSLSKFRTDEKIAKDVGESRETIRKYIRLTNLITPILDLVDKKIIAFSPAVEISYLSADLQEFLKDCIDSFDATPSYSQTVRFKRLYNEQKLTPEKIEEIMGEEKANQKLKYKVDYERFSKVLPKSLVTEKEVEDFLYKCVEEHNQRQKRRQLSR